MVMPPAAWEAAVMLLGLLPPLYLLYLLEVKGPLETEFERQQTLAKMNRHWHFYVINEKVALRYETDE